MSLRNTLLDNTQPLQMAVILKGLFLDAAYTTVMFATGYLDIPGLTLVYDELAAFLERPETSFKLLIGREPVVRSYQTVEPVAVPMDFPRDYIRRDLTELKLQPDYDKVAQLLLDYLSGDGEKFQIKVYGQKDKANPQFLHAKCYIFSSPVDSIGILGSSNFTQKGLEDNAELNYLETNSPIVTAVPGEGNSTKGHIHWFKEKWRASEDWNRQFLEEVRRSPIGKKAALKRMSKDAEPVVLSPYEIYIKFLIDQFGSQIDTDWKINQADFLPKDPAFKKLEYQIQAVNQAFPILNKHHVMILADVVGLGKTFVGIMIIKRYLMENGTSRPVLIITPPAIKKNWTSSIAYFDKDSAFKIAPHIRITTIGSIDRMARGIEEESEILSGDESDALDDLTNGTPSDFTQNNFTLILVDESHRFRNHDTSMYRQLQNVIARTSPHAKVVLLSATPQNNRPEDLRNQIGLFQTELRNSTLDTLGEEYGRNLESYFAGKQIEYKRLMKKYDIQGNPKTKTQIKADHEELRLLFKDIRRRIIEPLCIRRTRRDIERYFKDDMEKQGLKFPLIREPEKLDYKMNADLARLFYDTVNIIAPSISKTDVSPDGNFKLDLTDETKVLGYYRYRAIEYLADPKDKAFYERHNLKVKGISERLAQMMEIHLVKRLESSFTAFKESLRNLKRYCENMIAMLDDDTVFICPDLDINAELSPEKQALRGGVKMCYNEIERKMQRKDERNRKFAASAFVPEYRKLLENDRAIIETLISRWDRQSADPKLAAFLRKIDGVFFDPKINNPQNPADKKLIIFTEAIPTLNMLVDNLDAGDYEGKVLAITAGNRAENREIIEANFDANYDGEKRYDYQILITTDVLAEGVNLHRSNVILNYDSPWNSTRLMQRLGRINRIGSEADFINVYNFYPSAQGDAEINIVERAWNKIQAFHELFGEDSKIFSKEEEMVIHDIIRHDEEEGSESLKYIYAIKRFRAKNPRRYAELEALMEKVISAKGTGTSGTAAHVKNSRGQWYYVYTDHPHAISQQEMITLLECSESEKAAELDTAKLNAAVAAILKQYATDRLNENIRLKTGAAPKKRVQALGVVNAYANIPGLSPESAELLKAISNSIRNDNNVLIAEISKTTPAAEAAFAEADIAHWSQFAQRNTDNEAEGVVTLAVQCDGGVA
ncbi:MAG: DEAD/DEAH box helicase family protein [Treponema sp.]|jgi:SNF2 family DNA or RNA helicase|nr:DEAD/DEAH box helicase family protein [Treponema sp.]